RPARAGGPRRERPHLRARRRRLAALPAGVFAGERSGHLPPTPPPGPRDRVVGPLHDAAGDRRRSRSGDPAGRPPERRWADLAPDVRRRKASCPPWYGAGRDPQRRPGALGRGMWAPRRPVGWRALGARGVPLVGGGRALGGGRGPHGDDALPL